jgi:hypothetical protein
MVLHFQTTVCFYSFYFYLQCLSYGYWKTYSSAIVVSQSVAVHPILAKYRGKSDRYVQIIFLIDEATPHQQIVATKIKIWVIVSSSCPADYFTLTARQSNIIIQNGNCQDVMVNPNWKGL